MSLASDDSRRDSCAPADCTLQMRRTAPAVAARLVAVVLREDRDLEAPLMLISWSPPSSHQLSSSAPSTNPGESPGSTRSRRARPVSAGTLKRSPVITISASSPRRRRVGCSRNTPRVRASTCSSLETLVISVSSAVSKRSLAAVIVVPPFLDSPARRIPRCGRDIYTRPLDSRPLIHESPAFVLRRDPTTHVLRAVDDLGSRHFDPREKAHRRPIDEGDDILQIEYDATGRRGREQLLQGTSVLRGCALNCGFRNHSRPLTLLMSKPSRTA